MLYTILLIILIIFLLNIMFSFVPIDNRIAGVIMILVIIFLLFGGLGGGRRGLCEKLPPVTQDSEQVAHDIHRSSGGDCRQTG